METARFAETTAAPADDRARLELRIGGAVQGVGFRPFVFRLATTLGLRGRVANTPAGVRIAAEGPRPALDLFLRRIRDEAPPLSVIESMDCVWVAPVGDTAFVIDESDAAGERAALILPDVATCPDCLREIRDSSDRRYRYPFTNCTHCGPRFTIIRRLPYDRPNTSMAGFTLCPACRDEYDDPADRRFHAQPTACPACGPRLALWDSDGRTLGESDDALRQAADAIRRGQVVAVKGLGGFHLVVDARDEAAVRRLRESKRRDPVKPFALMYPRIDDIQEDCDVSPLEERLLQSPECPIVLLRRREGAARIAANVAPDTPRLGVMLPYTPLHHLLMDDLAFPVVATSGNLREEPICIDEREALMRLRGMADLFLVHDRPIVRHVDDSVVRVVLGRETVLRRARGFAPMPVRVREDGPPVLAVGAHLKNTVALSKGRSVFIGQHIGDLETPEAYDASVASADALAALYNAEPAVVAHDLHPAYLSTRRAQELPLPRVAVQHHFAHVLSCMAEHGLDGPVLGVAWDGSGYGPDGTVWGGEFLRATRDTYTRVAHLRAFRLPGGEQAVREPRRSALGVVYESLGPEAVSDPRFLELWGFSEREAAVLRAMIDRGVNAPVTTSAGRLFDAVSSLLGLRQLAGYEGHAAVALENVAEDASSSPYAFDLPFDAEDPTVLDWGPLIRQICEALWAGADPAALAGGFHNALARAVCAVAVREGIEDVVLTGGCFQNAVLLELAARRLWQQGLKPHWHRRIPPNDGGIALGQAVYAMRSCRNPKERGEDVPGGSGTDPEH